jgi:hypothetical protein
VRGRRKVGEGVILLLLVEKTDEIAEKSRATENAIHAPIVFWIEMSGVGQVMQACLAKLP